MKGKGVEKEHDTHFEPFKFRYRRAVGPIDENKVSCTLKMNVSQLIKKTKRFFYIKTQPYYFILALTMWKFHEKRKSTNRPENYNHWTKKGFAPNLLMANEYDIKMCKLRSKSGPERW